MRLTLTSSRPLNTVLTNEEGQALYTSKTPSKWSHRTTFICRVQPEYADHKYDVEEDEEETAGSSSQDSESPNVVGLSKIAQIHWQIIGSSTLKYRGTDISFNDYLHSEDIFGL